MFARRAIFAVLFSVTMAGSLWLAALALSPGGFGILDLAALVLFAITLPWMVAGFCNAVIGFVIMRFSADPVAAVIPAAGLIQGNEPVTASTAILLCVRNELPLRIIRNLEPMLEGIDASGYAERFHLYLLSDTNDADFAVREEALFSELIARWRDRIAISYRRRDREYRLQGRQYPRVLRDAGEAATSSRLRSMPTASCRQMRSSGSSGSCRSIPGSASCRGSSLDCRQRACSPASSSSACGSACVPIRSEARGGSPIAVLIGGTTPSCGSSRSSSTASFRCCPETARRSGISSVTTRSKRR